MLYLRSIINKTEEKLYAIEDKREDCNQPFSFFFVCVAIGFSQNDKFLFAFIAEIDMYEYFEHCIHAARLYILKEGDETIPAARRHMKVYVLF